jgi:3-methyladenine DNA glycosylase Mpg
VLVRAIEPTEGIEEMMLRRNMATPKPNLTAGPGVLSMALGIDSKHYGTPAHRRHHLDRRQRYNGARRRYSHRPSHRYRLRRGGCTATLALLAEGQ